MSRAQRLLDLIQVLRQHKYAIAGSALADALGISIRTLYRDIESLRAQGANIEGEPGMGYVLKPGFMLPPLMFTDVEIEALVLGSRWIGERADDELAQAARRALSKISTVLPADLKRMVDTTNLIIGPSTDQKTITIDLGAVRRSIREEKKVEIAYSDDKHKNSHRIIWPFALAFFDSGRIIIAWCELRQDFRHFRADRIMSWAPRSEKYPRRRNILLKEWRQSEGIGEP